MGSLLSKGIQKRLGKVGTGETLDVDVQSGVRGRIGEGGHDPLIRIVVQARIAKSRCGAIHTVAKFIVLEPLCCSTVPPAQSRSITFHPSAYWPPNGGVDNFL
jgi:hypothetical protein